MYVSFFQEYGHVFTGSRINDIRVVGFVLVSLLLVVALIGLDWEAKVCDCVCVCMCVCVCVVWNRNP